MMMMMGMMLGTTTCSPNANPTWNYRHQSWTFISAVVVVVVVIASARSQGFKPEGDTQGPIFITEPASHVDFSNFTGARIECVAHGSPVPVIRWTHVDGTPVEDVPNLRQVLRNGTLLFPPFRGEDYNSAIHAGVYRCSASNSVGNIVSRDINVRAVVNQYFEVQVYDEFVIVGNTAVLKCHIPSFVRDYVMVTSWVRVEGTNSYSTVIPDGRYVQTAVGDLYIQNVDVTDGSVSFHCETMHRLTGEARQSTPGRIVVTDPKSSVSPRITHSLSVVNVKQGDLVQLPCPSQGYPVPTFRWYRVKGRELVAAEDPERIRLHASFLTIERVQADDSGTYRCVVANSVGEERMDVVLRVSVTLSAHVQPQQQVVDVGKPATFTCSASGYPVSQVTWLHNGVPVVPSDRVQIISQWVLQITHVQKEDRGMFQCFVGNADETVQGTAELRLGDVLPTLSFTFTSKTVQQSAFVSLRCSASGHPPPQITWTLDDLPLPSRRFKTNDHVDSKGDVTSYVNISSARVEDGGNFRCSASNKAGKVDHVARLNVFGPPHIRPIPNVAAIAGNDVIINCHVSGYPIESIKWERDGNTLPANRRQQVFDNGTLLISQVDRASEEGTFTCIAKGPRGETARRQVNVKVLVPPLIEPFSFPRTVREGMRARLTCVVIQGDLPISIDWVKDGKRIAPDLDVSIKKDEEFSSSLTFPSISTFQTGSYSCIATNTVASANHTATLVVDVPPRWLVQPASKSVVFRSPVMLDCKAEGQPPPVITWKKSNTGEQPSDFHDLNMTHTHYRSFPNGSLLLHSASDRDHGHYMCEASNGVGPGLSKVVHLTVHAAAHFEQKFVNHTLKKGVPAIWNCRARGDAPITIEWMINGQKVNQLDHPRFSWNDRVSPDSRESEITILKVERHDAGSYSCLATNAYGKDETHFTINVIEVPDVPENVRVTDHGTRNVILVWNVPFDGNSPLTRYIVEYKNNTDDWPLSLNRTVDKTNSKVLVDGLYPGWTYNFRVLAENEVGFSTSSTSVTLTTSEEAPSGPPLSVEAKALGPQAVKISWKPPRKERQNGELLGYYVGYRIYEGSEPYIFQTVEANKRGGAAETLLTNLRKFTKYSVLVQAYNNIGSGPHSEEIIVYTSEDVPSGAPLNVFCSAIDSSTILVSWDPPQVALQNGLIQGYKVFYQPLVEFGVNEVNREQYEITPGTNQRTTIRQLDKYTNYSVQILAYTRMGNGVKSEPAYCRTQEDVPGPPGDIMALEMSSEDIIITWSPPKKPNGVIVKYNVYMRSLDRGEQQAKKFGHMDVNRLWHQVKNLLENQLYEFWVTASTAVGEGDSTVVVTQSPKSEVSARISSFPKRTSTLWRTDVLLPCMAVGIPPPSREWKLKDKLLPDSERHRLLGNGSLLIRNVQRTDAGKYTCRVENVFGSDEVIQELKVFAPPLPPHITVKQATTTSLNLTIKPTVEEGNPIQGYLIKYKRDYGGWKELDVQGEKDSVTLPDLHCGSRYQLRAAAYNEIGIGDVSKIVSASTRGSVPKVPPQEKVLQINTTSLTIRLAGWPDGGCPVRHFVIQYRPRHQRDFVLVSNNVPHRQEAFVIPDLNPGIIYHLHITAHNDAGSTVSEYEFNTFDGKVAGNMQSETGEEFLPFYQDISVAVPLFSSAITLVVVAVALCFFFRRRKYSRYQHSVTSSSQNEYPDVKVRELQEKERHPDNIIRSHCDNTFLSTPIRKSNQVLQHSNDPSAYPDKLNYVADYPSDVCPYATFRLPESKENPDGLPLSTFNEMDSLQRYPSRCKISNHRADMQYMEKERCYIEQPIDDHITTDGALSYLSHLRDNEEIHPMKSPETWGGDRYSNFIYDRDDHDFRYPVLNNINGSTLPMYEHTQVPDLLDHGTDSNTSNDSPEEKICDYTSEKFTSEHTKSNPSNNKKSSKRYWRRSSCEVHGTAR